MKISSYRCNTVSDHARNTFSGELAATAASIAVVIIRAFAKLCEILSLTAASISLHYFAKKIKAICVSHHAQHGSPPFPLLSYSKNIAKREVIFRDEDIKAAEAMRQLFFEMNPTMHSEKLKTAVIKGAKTHGICYGATTSFIKGCLSSTISYEEQLIAFAKQFEEGFDAEASALQTVYNKTVDLRNENIQEDVDSLNKMKEECSKETLEDLKDSPPPEERKAKIDNKIKSLDNISALLLSVKLKLKRLDKTMVAISKLIGVEIKDSRKYSFDKEEESKRFESEPCGIWQLCFHPDSLKFTSGHAIAYLNYDFGTYLFDPNYGLMPISKDSPSEAILTLQKFYYPGTTSKVRCRRYKLSTP